MQFGNLHHQTPDQLLQWLHHMPAAVFPVQYVIAPGAVVLLPAIVVGVAALQAPTAPGVVVLLPAIVVGVAVLPLSGQVYR